MAPSGKTKTTIRIVPMRNANTNHIRDPLPYVARCCLFYLKIKLKVHSRSRVNEL